MTKFNIHDHTHMSIEKMKSQEKVSKKGKVNLSSNELRHSKLEDFFKKFLTQDKAELFPRYPYFPDYNKSIAEMLKLNEDQLLLSAGSDDAIKIIIEAISYGTKRVVTHYPNYENYLYYAELRGIKCDIIPFNPEDFQTKLVNSFIEKTENMDPAAFILTNPNGFTGEAIDHNQIRLIAESCNKNNHLLIIDEAYSDFGHTSHRYLVDEYDNIIVIKTFSKSMGTAGMRVAITYASKPLIEYLGKWNFTNGVTGMSMESVIYSLNNKDTLKQILDDICAVRDSFILDLKHEKGIKIYESKSNFICFHVERPEELIGYLKDLNIAYKDLSKFSGFEGHLRVTIDESRIMEVIANTIKYYLDSEEYIDE